MSTRSWIFRSVADPASIFDVVENHLLVFVEQCGYGKYARCGLIERLKGHIRWARENGEAHVAFLYFWWLYASILPIQKAVDQIEMRVHPWTSPESLMRIREFAKSRIWDAKTTAFLPSNAKAIATKLRHAMMVAVIMRDGLVLEAPEPNPRDVIRKDLSEIAPQLFPEQMTDFKRTSERATKIKRVADLMSLAAEKGGVLPPEAIRLESKEEPWLERTFLSSSKKQRK